MHFPKTLFENLYTAPAVSEMKQSGIELKAQLVQTSVVAAPAVNRRIRSMRRLKAKRNRAESTACTSVRECMHFPKTFIKSI